MLLTQPWYFDTVDNDSAILLGTQIGEELGFPNDVSFIGRGADVGTPFVVSFGGELDGRIGYTLKLTNDSTILASFNPTTLPADQTFTFMVNVESTPEPTTILGLLTFGGAVLLTSKRKIK